jgi:hypothetical protein
MSKKQTRSRYVEYGDKIPGRYDWDQFEDYLTVTVDFGKSTKVKDLVCTISKEKLYLKKNDEPKPRIDGEMYQEIIMDESTWTIQDGLVEITLCKKPSQVKEGNIWWPCVVKGDPEISVKDIEGAKYLDDSILVKIWDQKQKEKKEKAAAAAAKAAEDANSEAPKQ